MNYIFVQTVVVSFMRANSNNFVAMYSELSKYQLLIAKHVICRFC